MASLSVYVTFAFHIYIPVEIAYPRIYKTCGPFKHPRVTLFGYRTLAIVMICWTTIHDFNKKFNQFILDLVANISNDLGAFISLVGCVTGSVLALILPAMLIIALDYGDLKWYETLEALVIVLVGAYGLFIGSFLSISDIVENLRNETMNSTL